MLAFSRFFFNARILLLSLSLAFLLISQAKAQSIIQNTNLTKELPTLNQMVVLDAQGKETSLAQVLSQNQQAELVLINFWATWCAPCLAEMPHLIALAQENPDLLLIAISEDLRPATSVESFINKQGWRAQSNEEAQKGQEILFLYDQKMKLLKQTRHSSIPVSLLYAANGQALGQTKGVIKEQDFEQLEHDLQHYRDQAADKE